MTLIAFSYSFVLSLILLSFIKLVPLAKQHQQIQLFTLLLATAVGYLSSILWPMEVLSPIWFLQFIGSNWITGIFWLTCISLFSEQSKIDKWQLGISLIPLLLATLDTSCEFFGYMSQSAFFTHATATSDIILVVHAMLITLSYWQDDLVEERRKARASVLLFTAIYIVLDIVIMQILKLDITWIQQLKAMVLAVLILLLHIRILSAQTTPLFEIGKAEPSRAELSLPRIEDKQVQQVIQFMEQEKAYQQDGLTIGSLAEQLKIQEYRLRKLINHELNYRNFNDFLNYYRINEAAQRLREDHYQEMQILTIALDVGFRSLSSFNKAFKETHEMTPSQYRKQQISQRQNAKETSRDS